LRHCTDCRFGMLLDERVVVRPVVADHVTYAPTGPRRQHLNVECHDARTNNLASGSFNLRGRRAVPVSPTKFSNFSQAETGAPPHLQDERISFETKEKGP